MNETTKNFSLAKSLGNGTERSCTQPPLLPPLERNFFAYCYPPLLIICVLANSISVLVYQHRFFKSSPTIRLLAAKAVANLLSISALLPTLLAVYPPLAEDPEAKWFYWHSTIYSGFLTNFFGHTAVIITALVTVERYVLVAYPVSGRRFSTMRNAMLGILLASVVSLLVHMEYPVNRYILEKQCRNTTLFYIRVHSKAYHLAYMYLNAVLVVLATLILFVFAVLIYYELFGRTRSVQSGQEQRQSATRLTVATASTFLFLTAPQSPIFLYHFFNKTPSSVAVTIGAVVNFCGLLETTAPFFVYYACSKRFRQLCVLLLCRSCVALKAEDLQVLEGNRTRTSSVITTADFRDSTRCRADSQPLLPVNLKANPPPKYNNNDDNHTTKELDQSI